MIKDANKDITSSTHPGILPIDDKETEKILIPDRPIGCCGGYVVQDKRISTIQYTYTYEYCTCTSELSMTPPEGFEESVVERETHDPNHTRSSPD